MLYEEEMKRFSVVKVSEDWIIFCNVHSEEVIRCPKELEFKNYVQVLHNVRSLMPIATNFEFYLEALGVVLTSKVQFESSDMGSIVDEMILALPMQTSSNCNHWNDILTMSRYNIVEIYQNLWNKGHYTTLLLYTNILYNDFIMQEMELRLDEKELLELTYDLEYIENYVISRIYEEQSFIPPNMVHDLFLCLMRSNHASFSSIKDIHPYLRGVESARLRLDFIYLITASYGLIHYDDILTTHNYYFTKYGVWHVEYFSYLLSVHGLRRLPQLQRVNREQLRSILEYVHGKNLSRHLRSYILSYRDTLRTMHSYIHHIVIQNKWLRDDFIATYCMKPNWEGTDSESMKWCLVDAIKDRYLECKEYKCFKEMLMFIDRCGLKKPAEAVLLDIRLQAELSNDILTPLYYIQYRHRNCPYAVQYREIIEAKEKLIRMVLVRKRLPMDVINYMLQWL